MMKKVWPVLLAVVLVFGLAMLGCGSKSSEEPPPSGGGEALSFTGPWDGVIKPWGNNQPTITGNEISITASSSTGFFINFADIGYTLNRADSLIFTYEIEVTTPKAVITAKNNWSELAGDSDWGVGKGREYVLGDDTQSEYVGPKVNGTWDPATKTGTFEVLMKYLTASTPMIGFQHNYWAQFGSGNVAESSVYKLKITKIENNAGEAPPPPPPPTGTAFFDDAVGLKTGIGVYGGGTHEFDGDTGILTISGNGGFSIDLPAGFTVADTISIEYACINDSEDPETTPVKFIKKQGSGWTDVGDASLYPTFNTEEVSTITVTGFNAAGITAGKAFFQTNGTFTAKIKIISVTRQEGAPIKITLAVPGLKPALGGTPVTTVDTAQYTGTVTWSPAVDTTFVTGQVYTATIVLTKKTSYTFEGVDADSLVVNGATTVTHDAGGTGTLTITAIFPAVAPPDPVAVWQPTITAATSTPGDGEYIGNTGIKRDSAAAEITLAPIDGGFTATVTAGSYKQFCVQVGTAAGGSNYYTSDGFAAVTGEDYTISFKVSVESGTGQLRACKNNNDNNWEKTQNLTDSPADFTYSWTQASGNLKFDTGNTAVNGKIIITDIKITTP